MNHLKTILVIAVAFLAFGAILTWPIEGMTTLVVLGFFFNCSQRVYSYLRVFQQKIILFTLNFYICKLTIKNKYTWKTTNSLP